ncbi:ATP-binding protein [Curtobacterium ammoniigenes]|uniref:ATP-binding protein n=1 Tax=Curtobacterium ammoniigenes TaxID=395387 RepID=UPI00082C0D3B|nr:sensor histidine kinase [Curtobacterium ammoniigenes]
MQAERRTRVRDLVTPHGRSTWSIAARLFVFQVVIVTVLTVAAVAWLWSDTKNALYAEAARTSMTVASSIAVDPFVHDALATPEPSVELEPYALTTMRATSTDFITIMRPDRTRYTHPNPSEIGKPFVGTIAPALQGHAFTETYTGTLGRSVRAVVPIRDARGRIIALVAAGVEVRSISAELWPRVLTVLLAGLGAIAVGACAAGLLSRYFRRVTWGRGPDEMSRMFVSYESVLHSIREGLVLVDRDRRVVLYNDHAAALLGLPARTGADEPRPLSELGLPHDLEQAFADGGERSDAVYVAGDRVLVVNAQEARSVPGRRLGSVGTVITLRDHTELRRLTGELQTMRTLSTALRAQSHEFANRLHTIIALIELDHPRRALAFAADQLEVGQRLSDEIVGSIDEPVLAALLLGKSAEARERGVELVLDIDPDLGRLDVDATELVTIVGNLVDNGIDAAATGGAPQRRVSVTVRREAGSRLRIRVADTGNGVPDVGAVFEYGFTTKDGDEVGRGVGLALVRQAVQRMGGTIDVVNDPGAVFTLILPVGEPAMAGER